jgi:hypothetical protein
MGERKWLHTGLALVGCFIVGTTVGVWFFALIGGHLFVMPPIALVASSLTGCLGVWAVAFVLVELAGLFRRAAPRSTR